MSGKFFKVWGWSRTERQKPRAGMSRTTRLVIRYKLLSTFLFVSTGVAFQGAPPPAQNPMREAREVRVAREVMVQAIEEGRLISPAGASAWDLYQRYVRLPLSFSERQEADDRIVIALGTAGDRILDSYRRGDPVVPLGAAAYEEGARLFGYASEIAPLDLELQAKAKFMEGQMLIEGGEVRQGIQALRQSVALDPGAAYSYNAIGIAYLRQKRWSDAIENFQAAADRAEKWVYPRFNLFRAYCGLSRFRDAERELRAGIALEDELGIEYSYLHYNLGMLYLYQGRVPEAELEFQRAQRS